MLAADMPPWCERCQTGRLDLYWQTCSNGTRHLRGHCAACGRLLKFVDQSVANCDEARRQGDRVYRPGGSPVPAKPANVDASAPRPVQRGLFDAVPEGATPAVADPDADADPGEWPDEAGGVAPPAWAELCRLEPRLLELAALADRCHPGPWPASKKFCANRAFYGKCHRPGLLDHLTRLIGPNAQRSGLLGTRSALEAAGRALYARLSSCGPACGCYWWRGMPWTRRVRRPSAA